MKKILLFLTLSYILLGDNFSCDRFVNMQKDKRKILIKEHIKLINPDSYTTKNIYTKEKISLRHINKCIQLFIALKTPTDNIKRYQALTKLSKINLNAKEKELYEKSLLKSLSYFSPYSDASLISKNSCQYPLIFLTTEEEKKGLLIYEKRLIEDKNIKTFYGYINTSKDFDFKCNSNKEYASYINKISLTNIKIKESL